MSEKKGEEKKREECDNTVPLPHFFAEGKNRRGKGKEKRRGETGHTLVVAFAFRSLRYEGGGREREEKKRGDRKGKKKKGEKANTAG